MFNTYLSSYANGCGGLRERKKPDLSGVYKGTLGFEIEMG